ncbi:hydroxymethylbilane synthase [Streptomyces cocklensis]|jgi:hydroxymethylbilane synthase|uniref:Hydroxymethylbilane synthase n=1 Tax=Actinacidiphila cocklensis TaxID=887465 RepID=A0A9W4DWU5_9ACTN|nr:hydroxymethylbilane synthase [Actinacidiphila cocklensis]MDD1060857.1 hydroxymethylbilane synthase [Actinacidiphila cocklensis]CAG6397472.1 Porphobilinogen deaminase 2 [Actinacidiphila cocklensis]
MNTFPTDRTLRIGTRSSPMALAQAHLVADLLRKEEPGLQVELVPVTTEADLWQGDLAKLGGKGLFVKQIDAMVQQGDVDMAVHCMKDVPGDVAVPEGLVFAAFLPRDDVRDVLLFPEGSALRTLDDLPAGAALATSAVRRKAQVARMRQDLEVVRVRGAVGTRIDKLDGRKPVDTVLDAMIVATSGLERLELTHRGRQVFTVDEMLPAVGAGVLGLECRDGDGPMTGLLARLNHGRTMAEVTAERAMLHGLQGHCNSPIAGYCVTGQDGRLSLRGMVFSEDGSAFVRAHVRGESSDPAALGARAAAELLGQGAREIIDGIPH